MHYQRLLIVAAMAAEEAAITKGLKFRREVLSKELKISAKIVALPKKRQWIIIQSGIGLVNGGLATALALQKIRH